MYRVFKHITIIAILLNTLSLFAQHTLQFTQYEFNTVAFNPAYAGTREDINATLLNRNQWVNVDGAPVTQTFTGDTNIPGSNVGVGLSFINDKIGFENTTYAYADISYTVMFNNYHRLSLGLKAGATKYSLDSELLMDSDAINDSYIDNISNEWQPNFGFGIYYRSDNWFLALSSPKVINSIPTTSKVHTKTSKYINLYITGGYIFNLSRSLKLKTTSLVALRTDNTKDVAYNLTASFLINDNLTIGGSYRIGDAVGLLTTVNIFDNLKAGYAYEYNTSKLGNSSVGSHEVFLNYKVSLFRPMSKCQCPNKF